MAGIKRKQSARRLKVEKLRGEGLTYPQIAKKLRVSLKTIKRDITKLNMEVSCEPAYTESRLQLREEFAKEYRRELLEIRRHMKMIEEGSAISEETTRPLKKGEVKKIPSPEEFRRSMGERGREELVAGMDATQLEITKKIFGPNWTAMAMHHKVLLECIRDWAKLFGLSIERETQVVKETEKTIQEGRVIFVDKASEEEFFEEVEAFKKGKLPKVVPLLDKPKGKGEGS